MTGVGHGSIATLPDPSPAAGELLLQPVISGVCSTDVHVFLEGALNPIVPLIIGHESVARVSELSDTDVWNAYGEQLPKVGDIVVVEPLFPCRTCLACVRGLPNLCNNSRHMGISRDGCFAEYFTAPAWRTTVVPLGVDPKRAIFVEPLACALHFVDLSGLRPGQTLVVLGAGPAGVLTAYVAVLAGLNVLVSEPEHTRRDLAQSLGARAVHPTQLASELTEATQGRGADAIVEVTGNPKAVAQALDLATRGTTLVLTGVSGDGRLQFDSNDVVLRELTIRGAVASRGHFSRAMKLVTEHGGPIDGLVSRIVRWTDADAAIRTVQLDRSIGKVLLAH